MSRNPMWSKAPLVLVPFIDPLAEIPPDLLLVTPALMIGLAFAALLLGSWLGGWIGDRRARSIPFGQAMCVAD